MTSLGARYEAKSINSLERHGASSGERLSSVKTFLTGYLANVEVTT